MKSFQLRNLSFLFLITSLGACASSPKTSSKEVILEGKSQQKVSGKLTFSEVEGGVRIQGDIAGLDANSVHGFHIHEKGDCSAPDAKSAGGHFAPEGHPHGSPDAEKSHAGDLGNLTADKEGLVHFDNVYDSISLRGKDKKSILGRAVVLHSGPDDLKSQPSGNSGSRIACGVIE